MAIQLAVHYFCGEAEMATSTAGSLDLVRMRRIKAIVLSKLGKKRLEADRGNLDESQNVYRTEVQAS